MDLLTELTILVLAAFVGFEVISKVPNTLHTPLMSATNAIHGIVLLGGLLVIGHAEGFLNDLLLVIAVAFGTINIDRKSTRLNSSHANISYAVFCLKKKKNSFDLSNIL